MLLSHGNPKRERGLAQPDKTLVHASGYDDLRADILPDQIIPALFLFQQRFDQLTYRALPTAERRNMMRSAADFGCGIGHGHAKTYLANNRQIGQIVADEANLFWRELQIL